MQDEIMEKAEKYIPQMKTDRNRKRLLAALDGQKKNLRDDNPFAELVGSYDVEVDVAADTIKKVSSIQNQINELISKQLQDQVFLMKPNDRKHVYFIDLATGKEEMKKISRVVSKFPESDRKRIEALMTQYPEPGKRGRTRIVISTDPVDILRKSSSRTWAHESCEAIGATYDEGPFSDIANDNAIAYLYVGDNAEPAGRIMLRWCVDDAGNTNVGVEPVIYPHGQAFKFSFYDALSNILQSKGYGKYDTCTTPYIYDGYSDQQGRGRDKIVYKKPGKSGLIAYAQDPGIAINIAKTLAQSDDVAVRAALAENAGVRAYPEVVKKLLNDSSLQVVRNAAINAEDISLTKDRIEYLLGRKPINSDEGHILADIKIAIAQKIRKSGTSS